VPTSKEIRAWSLDQLEKSQFFHQKLHEWGLLSIADEIEAIQGEKFEWDLTNLNISTNAWNKIIHRGIKPVKVFCHPEVIIENPRRISYYRMLAMVSQKSMAKVGLPVSSYESGAKKDLKYEIALRISRHLNKIVSSLIEHDETIDEREFDLWRGMTAGSQAQGSWQNIKGDKAEVLIKSIITQRVREAGILNKEKTLGKVREFILKDGRVLRMSSEPDIGIYMNGKPLVAIEIKGGIDTAGVHERFGAALKSLGRIKRDNPNSVTVLLMYEVSLTDSVKTELTQSNIVDHFFTIEDILYNAHSRNKLFKIMGI